MEQQQNAAPVNHGVLSSTGNVVGGTVVGGVKSGVKTYITTTLVCAALAAGITLLSIATGGVSGFFALGTVSNVVGQTLLFGTLGGLVGAAVIAPFTSIFGGLFGAVKGGSDAADRVRNEKGAANVVQAQVAAYKAQAQAEALGASNDNQRYNSFPAQGSPMNQAGSTVNAMQADGRVDGMHLQRA